MHTELDMNTDNEVQYLDLLKHVLENGRKRSDRTGTGTISTFAHQLRFDISQSIPLLTTKKMAWKSVIRELIWFLKGSTDASTLSKQGVHIWDGNTTREFLDTRGLTSLPEGDIGAGYGFQWRHFGATYKTCKDEYSELDGCDQVKYVLDMLRKDPTSRRIFMSAWNPLHMDKMALPPCHVSAQFYVDDDKGLSCHMYQRSVDCFLGLPFNIFSYSVLTYILAEMTGHKPCELIISTGDTHIYIDHVEQVKEQLSRAPLEPPCLRLSDAIKTKHVDELKIEDFELVGYQHHQPIKAKMSA